MRIARDSKIHHHYFGANRERENNSDSKLSFLLSKVMPCPVDSISYINITQGAGTTSASLIDFEGLPTNTIQHVQINGLDLKLGAKSKKPAVCTMVTGTYKDCNGCKACRGLTPESAVV